MLILGPITNNGGESCAGATPLDLSAVPDNVAGYRHEQLVNAAHIIQAGRDLGLSCRDQTIGVMTAMGESSLMVLDHGDAAGPDSRGLFQQRHNGAWGSYADRMNPYTSAANFFTVLEQVHERDALEPTIGSPGATQRRPLPLPPVLVTRPRRDGGDHRNVPRRLNAAEGMSPNAPARLAARDDALGDVGGRSMGTANPMPMFGRSDRALAEALILRASPATMDTLLRNGTSCSPRPEPSNLAAEPHDLQDRKTLR